MKVLCLTVERADANAVAAALPGTVAGATASWASRFEDAAQWALANPDVSAIVMDAQFGLESCGVFLNRLRRRGFTAQAILLLTTGHEATASLGLDPTDMVMPRAEFLLGLPVTLAEALSGRRQTAAPLPSRTILTSRPFSAPPAPQLDWLPRETSAPAPEAASGPALSPLPLTSTAPGVSTDRLTELEAALDKAERARAAETAAAEAQLARRTRAFAATVGDLLKTRETAERRLNEVALERDGLREQIESSASGAHRLTAVEADLHRAEAARETVEGALAATERQLSEAKTQAAEAATAQARAEAERGAALETLAAVRRDAADADARLAREREVGAERFGRREAELSALLEQEIEKRLERETALTRAERVWQHATAEQAVALEAAERRLADAHERLDADRKQAAAERATLENRATEAEALAARRQHNHAAALSDLHGLALDASALDARLAELTRANEDLDHRLAEAARAQEACDAEVAGDRLAAAQQAARQQEQVADLAAAKSGVEARLAEAQTARAALDAHLTERQAAVTALEAQLAEAEGVRLALQSEHAAALFTAAAEFAQQEAVRVQAATAAAALAAEQLAHRERELADIQAVRETLEQRVLETERDLAETTARTVREREATEAQTARIEAGLRKQLAELASAKSGVEARLAEAQAARAALAAQLTERQTAVAGLEAQLAEAEGVRLALQSEHAAALFTAAAEFAQREAAREQQARDAAALTAKLLAQRERALADVQAVLDRQTDVAEQLRTELAQLRAEAERSRHAAAAREDAAAHQREQLAELAAAKSGLEAQLADAQSARAAFEAQLTERQAAVTAFETRLAESEGVRQALQADHVAALFTAAAEFAQREAVREQQATAAATLAAEQLAQHQRELADVQAARETLEQRVLETEHDLAETTARTVREREATEAQTARVEAGLREQLAELAVAKSGVEAQLAEARAAQAALDAELTGRQAAVAALEAQLAEADGVRLALQAEHAAALSTAAAEFAQREALREQQATAAAAVAAGQVARRERELADVQAALGRQTDATAQLRAEIAQLRTEAERSRHAAAAREDAAARQREQLAELAAAKSSLEAQLAETQAARAALDAQVTERQADVAALETELADAKTRAAGQLADARASLEAERRIGAQLGDQLARAQEDARAQLADANAGQLELEHQITTLTARLAEADMDRRGLDERLVAASAALATAQQTIAAQEALLVVGRGRENELNALLSSAAAAHHALDAQRLDAERATHEVEDRATRELAAVGEQILDLEARLGDETALCESVERERDALQQALGSTRQEIERQIVEYAVAVTALETAAAGYQAHIAALSAQNAELEQAAEHAVARLRDDLQVAIAAHERDLERLQAEHRRLTQQFDSVEKQRDAAREQAGQVLVLRNQLRELQAQTSRQFDEHPSPICQCTEQGVPQRANRAFADLLGCPPGDERVTLEYAAAQFSSSRDIAWLAERCRTGASDTADCAWKTMQGGLVTVRLHARATPDGFDLIAEDRSSVRTLEDRLNRTKRLESVGRLAAEVAASCGRILADVRRDAEEWIAVLGPQAQAEHQVESILTEIGRAHTLLQRLDAFADEQTKALEPVDVHRVLRDLEPVLKEIAGDDVEVLLPKRPSRRAAALLVDVKAERLERVLVNAANFARARMPHGGTIAFELEETVVDRPFVDRYPSARIGRHALLTITETRQPIRGIANGGPGSTAGARRAGLGSAGDGALGRSEAVDDMAELAGMVSEANDESRPADQSSVDLAPLQDLVRTCGGHLWIEAAASGNMVLKIHLPLRVPDERRWPTFGLASFRSSGS